MRPGAVGPAPVIEDRSALEPGPGLELPPGAGFGTRRDFRPSLYVTGGVRPPCPCAPRRVHARHLDIVLPDRPVVQADVHDRRPPPVADGGWPPLNRDFPTARRGPAVG